MTIFVESVSISPEFLERICTCKHLTKGKCDIIFSSIRQSRTGCVAVLGDTLCPRLEITSIKQYMRSRLVLRQLDQPFKGRMV